MFITRASRHDHADLRDFLAANGWGGDDVARGVTFFARDGAIVGSVKLVEVAPQTVVVDDMVVAESRRGEGIGGSLMRAAMNSRGGTLYLCCHEATLGFYRQFGFSPIEADGLPEPVLTYLRSTGDHPAPEGHPEHFFMTAR